MSSWHQTQHYIPQFTLILVVSLLIYPSNAASNTSQLLLQFKQSLTNSTALSNWHASFGSPCRVSTPDWAGVLCVNGTVRGLQLENMSLAGPINIHPLVHVSTIRSISLMNNSFSGPLPSFNKLTWLKSLFLSYNNFTGELNDDVFAGMRQLKKVYVAHNGLSGRIPKSLAGLTRLLEVSFAGNGFSGHVPEFRSHELRFVDFSNNKLEGPIPPSLSKFNSSSFQGNSGLCGQPLALCKPPSNAVVPIVIIIVVTIGLVAVISVAFIIRRSRQLKRSTSTRIEPLQADKARKPPNRYDLYPNRSRALDRPTSYKKSDNGKLCFLRNDRQKFEMQDLLKASAEVLGSGSFGSSYKATILGGPMFVVKRFRQMNNVAKEEFQEHMKRVGRMRHPNLLPLIAYFHKREEKLLISDFVENGSLASHLHGRRTPDQPGISWAKRLKIIKGVARGLAYLYRELPHLVLPHGHLKSSNVLLDDSFEPLLSDYALAPVITREHAEQVMVAYKSPEFIQANILNKKTDVWCLGILILETLTGKFPANYLKHGKGGMDDLATWVESIVKDEWTVEMLDVEMEATRSAKRELLKLLKIGMWCCEWNVEKRWSIREAVEMIEELKESDSDEPSFPSYRSKRSYSTISSITEENVLIHEQFQ